MRIIGLAQRWPADGAPVGRRSAGACGMSFAVTGKLAWLTNQGTLGKGVLGAKVGCARNRGVQVLRNRAAHRSAVVKALKPCVEGTDPLVEKVGSNFRIRNRFLRLWLCTQKILIQELIPQLRDEGQYRVSITRVCPQLPFDSGLDG
jgi:hypothetical protein